VLSREVLWWCESMYGYAINSTGEGAMLREWDGHPTSDQYKTSVSGADPFGAAATSSPPSPIAC
jgi:hypothetical protein